MTVIIKNNKYKVHLKDFICDYNKGIDQNNETMIMKCVECNNDKTILDNYQCQSNYNCSNYNKFDYYLTPYQIICSKDCEINEIQFNIINNQNCLVACEDGYGIKNKNNYVCVKCNYPNVLIEDVCVFHASLCPQYIMSVVTSDNVSKCLPIEEANSDKNETEICNN